MLPQHCTHTPVCFLSCKEPRCVHLTEVDIIQTRTYVRRYIEEEVVCSLVWHWINMANTYLIEVLYNSTPPSVWCHCCAPCHVWYIPGIHRCKQPVPGHWPPPVATLDCFGHMQMGGREHDSLLSNTGTQYMRISYLAYACCVYSL